MNIYRYSEWDGGQSLFDLDADELMDMLKRHAMESYGRDLAQKLKDMDANT
ncbi:unnamed protein product [marine sediment metagenome]|uniref:Uncharacterized protein n=1 Tax=marine sediment metagenome TaxID=412755 RepID=X0WL14_9ZZZZ